eukprot:gene2768-biopygen541
MTRNPWKEKPAGASGKCPGVLSASPQFDSTRGESWVRRCRRAPAGPSEDTSTRRAKSLLGETAADADRTIEVKETDADRTRTGCGRGRFSLSP